VAKFYDLFRDTREEYPVSTEVGAWAEARSLCGSSNATRKAEFPYEEPAFGRPYDGIENLRPETKAAVEAFRIKQSAPSLK